MNIGIAEILIALLGGGGLTALITAWNSKNKSNNDIAYSNVKTALELKDYIKSEYFTVAEELAEARRLINSAEERIAKANRYISQLQDLLKKHGISYPEEKI